MIRRFAKAVVAGVSLCLVLGLLAGAGTAAKDTIVIGFSQYTQKAPFYAEMVRASREAAAAIPGVKLIVLDGQDDLAKQIADVEDLIAQKVDVILLNPKDPKALLPAVEKVNAAKIPLLITDSTIDPSATYVSLLKSDNFTIGKMTGEKLADRFKGKCNLVLISGAIGNIGGFDRRAGMVAGFVERSMVKWNRCELTVLTQGWGGWTHAGGQKAMEDILVAQPNIDAVFAENDSMALGALKAIQERKRTGIVLAGIDGEKGALELIKKGDYLASGLNSPTILGKLQIEVAVKVARGEKVPSLIYTPADVVTKENVDKYYDPKSYF